MNELIAKTIKEYHINTTSKDIEAQRTTHFFDSPYFTDAILEYPKK